MGAFKTVTLIYNRRQRFQRLTGLKDFNSNATILNAPLLICSKASCKKNLSLAAWIGVTPVVCNCN
jgi:hypothetical protein